MIDKPKLLEMLKRQKKAALLELLEQAFDALEPSGRLEIFGPLFRKPPKARIKPSELLEEVVQFERDSRAKKYYRPFMIDSKNFRHVPDKTREWFSQMGTLLGDASRLSRQGDHAEAAACFERLYALIEKMEDGDEIVFADEYGGWMIPGEEKVWTADYLASLAATTTPEEFGARVVPLVRRDGYQSFSAHVYPTALEAASPEQAKVLEAELRRLKVPTGPQSRTPRS